MLAEQGKEGERFLPESFHGVFDQLGRHETEAFTNMTVMPGDFFGQFLYCLLYTSKMCIRDSLYAIWFILFCFCGRLSPPRFYNSTILSTLPYNMERMLVLSTPLYSV